MKSIFLIAATTGLIIASCAEGTKAKLAESEPIVAEANIEIEEPISEEPATIVDIAADNVDFTTLVTAVKEAGLVETLSSDGPFTVFAPTNEAFEKLPEGTVDTLLEKDNKEMLTDILTYHVVAGKYMAANVLKAIEDNNGKFVAKTVMGEEIILMLDEDNVIVQDAKGGKSTIVITDVEASNGVIHAIDTVIMPVVQ